MKKSLLFLLTFLNFSFAFAEVYLQASPSEGVHIAEMEGRVVQSVESDNGIAVSCSAKLADSEIKFYVDVKNDSEEEIYLDNKLIKVYEGNRDNDDWKLCSYVPAEEYLSDIEGAEKAAAVIGVVTAAVVTTAIIADVIASSPANSRHPHNPPSPRHAPPPPHFEPNYDPFWDSLALYGLMELLDDDFVPEDNNYLERSLLYSKKIDSGNEYAGIFYVGVDKRPDYRLSIELCGEEYNFYFSRSDREDILHPFREKDEISAFLFGTNILKPAGVDFYYFYSSDFLGFYLGMNMNFDSLWYSDSPSAVVKDSDFSRIYLSSDYHLPASYDPSKTYEYKFNKTSAQEVMDCFGFTMGLSFKVLPHSYVLLGCGVDFGVPYYYGNYYWKISGEDDSTYEKIGKLLVEDRDTTKAFCVPQAGVLFSFGDFNISTMYSYRIMNNKSLLTLMVGMNY